MAKEALGRGLGALLGEMEEVYDNEVPTTHNVLELPLSEVKANPYQPRKTFDEKSLAELADSLKQHGQIQPIVVVEDIDGYVLVAGERRLRASKLAKLKTIKAVVVSLDEAQMRQHALVENIQRDQLNAIELAHAYEELLKVHDLTHEELSGMIHKSRSQITNTLRLLQLGKKAQKMLLEDKITAGHAKVLVGLDEKEQNMMVDSIIGQKLSVRDVENMAKQMKQQPPSSAKSSKQPTGPDFSELQAVLKTLGYKSSATGSKITIE
ncbi:MAG: ParB/RepB/Spo0J family partition protein, partial [Sulfurimonadaceae bacterium]|nr:ParB/RepB/Spo0J family partition protein [Sulfurimonadaceae bacterium]